MEWLPDDKYNKGKFLLRGAIMEILNPLRMYGQSAYVDQAILELGKLFDDWGLYVRGAPKPLNINYVRRDKEE